MKKIKSSNIDWIQYNPETNTLEVCFVNGHTYTYDNVPGKLWNELDTSEEPGKYFAKNIRKDFKGIKREKE